MGLWGQQVKKCQRWPSTHWHSSWFWEESPRCFQTREDLKISPASSGSALESPRNGAWPKHLQGEVSRRLLVRCGFGLSSSWHLILSKRNLLSAVFQILRPKVRLMDPNSSEDEPNFLPRQSWHLLHSALHSVDISLDLKSPPRIKGPMYAFK